MVDIPAGAIQTQRLDTIQDRRRVQNEIAQDVQDKRQRTDIVAERRQQRALEIQQAEERRDLQRLDDRERFRDALTEASLQRARLNEIEGNEFLDDLPRGSIVDVIA